MTPMRPPRSASSSRSSSLIPRLLYHTHNVHALLSLFVGGLLLLAPRNETLRETFVPDAQERLACAACLHSIDLQQVLGMSLLFVALLLRVFRGVAHRPTAVALYCALAPFMLASAVLRLTFVLTPAEWFSFGFALFSGVVYSLGIYHYL